MHEGAGCAAVLELLTRLGDHRLRLDVAAYPLDEQPMRSFGITVPVLRGRAVFVASA